MGKTRAIKAGGGCCGHQATLPYHVITTTSAKSLTKTRTRYFHTPRESLLLSEYATYSNGANLPGTLAKAYPNHG